MNAPFSPTSATTSEIDGLITLVGAERSPRQMLATQNYDGHTSVHDEETADALGLAGAPIEGPTHFSQFDPLGCSLWGPRWFESGCVSAHFSTMVLEGETVRATMQKQSEKSARIESTKPSDGSVVLSGTASIDGNGETELDHRRAKLREPGALFILDQLKLGDTSKSLEPVAIDFDTSNGPLYPFTLREKLERITEFSPWYDSSDNPWGRPILPFEMISVLANKTSHDFSVRGPSVGLFLDLEIRLEGRPLFGGHAYRLEREIVALGESRRTESYWVRTSVIDDETGIARATVLLHSGVFKASYAKYPADRLSTNG